MKIKIVTLGCKLNFAESSALMHQLLSEGHTRVKAGEQADLVIVNTCSLREEGEGTEDRHSAADGEMYRYSEDEDSEGEETIH